MIRIIRILILLLINFIEKVQYWNYELSEDDIKLKVLTEKNIEGVKVLTDSGFQPVTKYYETQPYKIIKIETALGLSLEGADLHKVFDKNFNEIYFKDLKVGDEIQTINGLDFITKIEKTPIKIGMCDITVDHPDHRYYTNGILSHNTICSSIFVAWYILFNFDKNALILSNKGATTREIVDKAKTILENLPFFLKPGVIKNDVFNMKFDNGCRIVAQSTTGKAGIGFTIHLLFLDEFAHIHNNFVDSFFENVFPTISSSQVSRTIITSTPNGYNKFHDIYVEAEKGESDFAPFRVDWWQVPGRDNDWMKREVRNLGSEEAFNRQYGNLFASGDSLLLGPNEISDLDKNVTNFISHQFDDIEDIEIKYAQELLWHPDFDTDDTQNDEKYYVFSVDIAEGSLRDYSIINMFEIEIMPELDFKRLHNPGSFMDFFRIRQIGRFKSNEHSIEEFSKILYTLAFDIFYSENLKIVIEWNAFGGELLKNLETIFPQRNEFDEELIVKFKHRNDAKTSKFGLKVKMDNKPIFCQKFKKYQREHKIMLYDKDTIEEAKKFGRSPSGKYEGQNGHDDLVMTAINVSEFFQTLDFSDFVEELYEEVPDEIKKKMNLILEKTAKGDGTLHFDIYDLLGAGGDKVVKGDMDFF